MAEAIVAKLPLTARQKGLAAFGNALDTMLIDALLEWENIQVGDEGAPETTRRWHMLMRLRHEVEMKHLPTGLPVKRQLFRLAEQSAASYLELNYETGRIP